MILLYVVLGYLVVALGFSLFMEYKQKTWIGSNKRIQSILDRSRRGMAEYVREGLEDGLGQEWEDEIPDDLIDHTRQQLIEKRNLQQRKIHSEKAILLTSLTWPLVVIIFFYIMVFHTPKKGETYEEWVRRVEDEKK